MLKFVTISLEFVLILNPDVVLEKDTLDELFLASKQISNFSIMGPLEKSFINYEILREELHDKSSGKTNLNLRMNVRAKFLQISRTLLNFASLNIKSTCHDLWKI